MTLHDGELFLGTLADLEDFLSWRRLSTGAVQVYLSVFEHLELEWVANIDENTCDYCDGQHGRRYRLGQFIPQIPAPQCHGARRHDRPNPCRCGYRLVPW